MRAFLYSRVSTDRQELSPMAQMEQARAYCASRGYVVAETFDESGVSGCVEFAKRQRGAEILSRLAEFDVIVFSRLDRAFRSTVDAILTVQRLSAAGKVIVFLDMNLDTSTPAGMLCLQMMSAFAEFERKRIGERIGDALAVAKKQGKKIGPAPFGFRNSAHMVDGRKVDGGLHEAVEDEATALTLIRAWRKEGFSFREIASLLAGKGIPTRRGGKWHPFTVAKVLRRMA